MDEKIPQLGQNESGASKLASSIRNAFLVIVAALLIGAVVGTIASLPELKRYINIKQM